MEMKKWNGKGWDETASEREEIIADGSHVDWLHNINARDAVAAIA